MDLTESIVDLSYLTKTELLSKCEELGIKRCKSKNKDKLIELINAKLQIQTNKNQLINDINIDIDNENTFIDNIKETIRLYIKDGARSNSNVDYFHNCIKKHLLNLLHNKPNYSVELEYCVKSTNSSGLKKCDIVILKNNTPYIVFPVKIIKTNYKQNKKSHVVSYNDDAENHLEEVNKRLNN